MIDNHDKVRFLWVCPLHKARPASDSWQACYMRLLFYSSNKLRVSTDLYPYSAVQKAMLKPHSFRQDGCKRQVLRQGCAGQMIEEG